MTEAEADRVTELFTLAFYDDPTWGWAFPDPDQRMDQHRMWWGLYMHSALAYGWVWMTNDGGAAALWIPPGEPELSDEDEARVEPLLRELLGSLADDVLALLDRFDANHPRHAPQYYLSLLGTHPDHRGGGKSMGLLAANLAQIDGAGQSGLPGVEQSRQRPPLRAPRFRASEAVRSAVRRADGGLHVARPAVTSNDIVGSMSEASSSGSPCRPLAGR